MISLIKERIADSIDLKQRLLADEYFLTEIAAAAEVIKETMKQGGKVLFCGNGGSASDALHLTAEFVGRFQKARKGLPAMALNADIAVLTSVSNDYGYDSVFARSVEALMKPEDVLVGISTSGNSENVYRAILAGKEIGGKTISLLGKSGGKIKEVSDISLIVPGDCTARIQECHILIGHIICELVEE